MSEDAIREIFGDDVAEIENEEVAQEEEQSSADIERGLKHQSIEEWTASGKDPSQWKTKEHFDEIGRRISAEKQLRKVISNTESRIANLNKLHRIQLEQKHNKLLLERDNAIDTADRAEVRRLDQAIEQNKLMQNELVDEPQKPAEVVEWESENQWIFDHEDPRTAPAIAAFTEAQNAGKTMASCILAADRAAAKVQVTPPIVKRTPTSSADAPKARQSSGGKIQLSMKDIPKDQMYARSFYNSDAEFLRAFQDSLEASK